MSTGKQPDFKTHALGFEWLERNARPEKPRGRGITEIRASYYSFFGPSHLRDLLETCGNWIDSIKFAGGAFTLMNPDKVREMIDLAHEHGTLVSTGGFIEYVLTQGTAAVDRYIEECKGLGFDIIELSTGFISIPADDWLRLVERVRGAGLKAKPEIGVQFGAGGDTPGAQLESEGLQDVEFAIAQAERFLEAGAYMIMIESEGITENADPWRVEIPAQFVNAIGLEPLMFEAADPRVFEWYIKSYGPDVNLFVDHSQLVQLECYRQGIWGTHSIWGRIRTYQP